MADYIIKQIAVGSTPYDINAKYIQDETGTGKTWANIKELVETSFDIVVMAGSATLPTANASVYAQYKNNIVLCNNGQTQEDGSYIEWVITNQSGTYKWEQIGTSKTDLEEYGIAATYTTSLNDGPTVTGATSGAGAVTGTVTYQKASTAQTAGAHTHGVTFSTSSFAKGVTTGGTQEIWAATKAKDTFTAVKGISTTSGTVGLTGGYFTPTTKYVKVASTGAAGTTTVLTGVKVTGSTTVVTGYPSFTGGSASGTFLSGVKSNASVTGNKNYGFTASTSVLKSATVSDTGILSWDTATADTQDVHSMTQMSFNTASVSWTAASLGAPSTASVATNVGQNGTASVAVEGIKGVTLNVATTSSTGAQQFIESAAHANPALSGDITFIKKVEASDTDTAISSLQADGKVTVIKSTGLYYDNAVTGDIATVSAGGHTHSISTATANAEIDLSAAMPSHTHTIDKHTHTVGVKNNKGVVPTTPTA